MDKIKLRPIPVTGQPCEDCGKKMFAITDATSGGDIQTCPICECWSYDRIPPELYDGIFYCKDCHILFQGGCVHAMHGCTFDVGNGMRISSFEYEDIKYEGMPVFESYEHSVEMFPDLKLNWFCTCGNVQRDCPKDGFPNWPKDKCNYYEKK